MVHRAVVVLALALLLVACGAEEVEQDFSQDIQEETPQEAVDLTLQVAADECELLPGDECREFKLTCSESLELAEADEAKNIESKWCLAIGFEKRSPTIGPEWQDSEIYFSVESVEGEWQEKGTCVCRIGEGTESSEE
jgi:hypothetical protein